MALGVSLRWFGQVAGAAGLERRLVEVRNSGFEAIEACNLDTGAARVLRKAAERSSVRLLSVHGPCPEAAAGPGRRHPGDWLASVDGHEWSTAMGFARGTVDFARDLGIPFVVMHLGVIPMTSAQSELARLLSAGPSARSAFCARRDKYRAERSTRLQPHLERARRALADLVERAAGRTTICIENRYQHHQIPNIDDAIELLAGYGGAAGYWHDTGHFQVQRALGLADDHRAEALHGFLRGLHVHDARIVDDHLPPGTGDVDFVAAAQLAGAATPVILEPAPSLGTSDLARAHSYLVQAGFAP